MEITLHCKPIPSKVVKSIGDLSGELVYIDNLGNTVQIDSTLWQADQRNTPRR